MLVTWVFHENMASCQYNQSDKEGKVMTITVENKNRYGNLKDGSHSESKEPLQERDR
jgi:uncharacterized membrane protein YvbJ